jgi:8-oxo-dGTP pyrophosphatase MutT (NUDIX family)
MNERIRELMEEAGFTVENGHIQSLAYKQTEKLVELIVVECMDVFGRDLPEPGDGRITEVIDRICNVAEHFGVDNGR